MTVHRISKKFVDEALAKSESFKDKSDDELSVLQKLIKKCGKNSQIPLGKFSYNNAKCR